MLNKIIKSFGICLSVLFIYNNYAYGITAGSSVGATGTNCVDFSDESTCNTIECVLDRTSGMGGQNCKSYELICYRNGGAGGATGSLNLFTKSCTECNDGYTFAQSLSSVTSGTANYCTVKFKTCVEKEDVTIVECPDACPSETEYRPTTLNREAICVKTATSATCKYRCQDGFYNITPGRVLPTCASCAAHATCTDGIILCNRGTWRKNNNNASQGTITVTCTLCPALINVTGAVMGTTAPDRQALKVTDCYIPASQSIKDASGTFNFIKDCYYSE